VSGDGVFGLTGGGGNPALDPISGSFGVPAPGGGNAALEGLDSFAPSGSALGHSLLGGNASLPGVGSFGRGLGLGGVGGSGNADLGELGAAGGARFSASGSGLSERAQNINELGLGEARPSGGSAADPAELAAAENAAEEGEMLGRVATVGGGTPAAGGEEPPMMPPMSGGMGGTGGGGASGKKTWVTEDEETWGTTTTAGTGVLGR
jgi:hypothetical protein